MKLPATIIALFASLLIFGCATNEQQLTPGPRPYKEMGKETKRGRLTASFQSLRLPAIRTL